MKGAILNYTETHLIVNQEHTKWKEAVNLVGFLFKKTKFLAQTYASMLNTTNIVFKTFTLRCVPMTRTSNVQYRMDEININAAY